MSRQRWPPQRYQASQLVNLCMKALQGKTLDKLRGIVASGSHYEAQQMLKTVYHRHKARKQIAESHAVLKEGAMLQLQNNQVTCGVELGLLLIQAFAQDKPPAHDALSMVMAILSCLPRELDLAGPAAEEATLDEELRFVAAAAKWAAKQGQAEAARQIHDAFAWHVWQLYGWRRFGRASLHFARGSDAERFAEAVHACASEAPGREADLFVSRSVLQTLAVASNRASLQPQLAHARQLLACVQRLLAMQASKELAPVLDSPLMHFTALLLEALDKRSRALTTLLKQRYQTSLARDPVLAAYLTQVERVFLGVGASAGGLGGMLGSLLKSLTTDGDEDDEGED